MKPMPPSLISFFYRTRNQRAKSWESKIRSWLKKKFPDIEITSPNKCQILIALGGDGTILEAARKYQNLGLVIAGLNLGHVGFLASVRKEKNFLSGLEKIMEGQYHVAQRMMLSAAVLRKNEVVFTATALNEIVVQNPLGMVQLEVAINNHTAQYVRGTGAMVTTPTGSTAFNLSSHGPIVVPDLECMIISEILDHNIPTPSMLVKSNDAITINVSSFRPRNLISIAKTDSPADVLLVVDGQTIFPLLKNDMIKIGKSNNLVRFAEVEKNYFLKSLKEKFGFK
jgi:NAD+ kinase